MFWHDTASEKLPAVGMPVEIVSWLDCVPMFEAPTTRRHRHRCCHRAGIDDGLHIALRSLVAVAEVSVMPPTVVLSAKATVAPHSAAG